MISLSPSNPGSSNPGSSNPGSPYWQVPVPERNGRVFAGVAGGIAAEVGIDPIWVRIGFVALFAAGGWGALLYLVLWGAMALHDHRRTAPIGPRRPKGRTTAQRGIGVALVVVGLFSAFQPMVGLPWTYVWPVGMVGVGLVVAWSRSAPPQDRRAMGIARTVGGLAIAVLGVIAILRSLNGWSGSGWGVTIGLGLGVAIVAASGPWWWRLLSDLDAERQARIRSEERAEVAAHLHDSVLQTLSLIQRNGDDPQQMVHLARRQERELRNWLDADRASRAGGSIRGRLDEMATDVEGLHGVPVEIVAVGDCLVDERIEALLAAAREAAVNAARHSGTDRIDCYVEVSPSSVEIFVRDSGRGFDRAAVAPDRRGLRDSIERRMWRAGGTATVVTDIGIGTEVELMLPRTATHGHDTQKTDGADAPT